jgi:hypothetical protein
MNGHVVRFVLQRRVLSVLLPLAAITLAVLVAGYGNQWRGRDVLAGDVQARQDGTLLLIALAVLTALWLPGEVSRYQAGGTRRGCGRNSPSPPPRHRHMSNWCRPPPPRARRPGGHCW